MGSLRDHEVVLLELDSDLELQHVSKRQKPAPLAPFKKPFMQDSDSDRDDPLPALAAPLHAKDTGEEDEYENGEADEDDARAVSPDSALSASMSSEDLQEISAERPDEEEQHRRALERDISDTRKFLKANGPVPFLQEYLPATASSEDIYDLIGRLGFKPKNFPPLADGESLLQLIKLLHMAMKRVRELRYRIDTFYTVNHVLDKLRSAQRILVITGAGISTSLGIPDFRSSQGFYSKISALGLDDPQEVFDLQMFHLFPLNFYSIAHLILPPDNVYAPLHKFIRLLETKGKLLRNYTQNIDNLEANAGILEDKLIQCHGSFALATCVTCGYQVKGLTLYPHMRQKEIPYCPKCSKKRKKLMNTDDVVMEESYGVMKPNITFFGEALPRLFHDHINRDLQQCDLLISIGTSLKVAPVADIVDKIPGNVPQVLINKDPIHHCNFDVSLLGYCDDVVAYLCHRLGEEWAIDHPQYEELVGDDNLELEEAGERGVYNIKNKQRELEFAKVPPSAPPEPDLVVLEPTIH